METATTGPEFRLLGGDAALDFMNTRSGPDAPELLTDYDALLRFGLAAGAINELEAHRLRQQAYTGPRAEESTHARAVELRQAMADVFEAAIEGRRPPTDAIVNLRSAESRAVAHAKLIRQGSTFEWTWGNDGDLGRPIWPIVHAAIELLTNGPLDRVKRCQTCRWWFVDRSKNRSRRWCSMTDCGTAAKSKAFVARRAAKRG